MLNIQFQRRRFLSISSRFETSPFKGQSTTKSHWLPLPDSSVPDPRPGQCQNTVFKRDQNSKKSDSPDSSTANQTASNGGGGQDPALTFIKQHPLLAESVSPPGLDTSLICFLFVKKLLICLEDKSMTPCLGNSIFCSLATLSFWSQTLKGLFELTW